MDEPKPTLVERAAHVLFVTAAVALSPVILVVVAIDSALNGSRRRERVLELLANGQWWRTLDMIKELKGASPGWLYTTLQALEDEGFVVSKPDAQREGARPATGEQANQ